MKPLPIFIFFLLTPPIVVAQVTQNTPITVDGKVTQYVQLAELTVTPQKPPVPALKYKLTWGFDQRVKNNAAIQYNFASRELAQMKFDHLADETRKFEEDYGRLFTEPKFFKEKKSEHDTFKKMLDALSNDAPKTAETLRFEASQRYKPMAYSWFCNKPTSEFPVEYARKFVDQLRSVYRFLETGSRCDYCDWEYHFRGNKNIFALLLPEVQESRDLSRALMVKARLEIHDKNYTEAIKTIRVGKTLARHVGQGCPLFVGHLVGIAIDSQMNECLLELVQKPDAPNLYWTLTAVPGSPFSRHKAFELEMDVIRLTFPEVARAMDDPDSLTENDWKELHRSLIQAIPLICDDAYPIVETGGPMATLFAGGWGITAYPKAKQWLASQGKTPEEIENMSVSQAVGLWSIHRFEIARDNYLKIVSLPFWQSKEKYATDRYWDEFESVTPLDAIVRLLFPAEAYYHSAICRLEASGDVLRIVEAIRYYAAENDGKLPPTLDAIQSVPIPQTDPFTGKPYVYRIENGRAVVEYDPGYGIYRTVIEMRNEK
ncbi:MAG: hypothetical protein FWC43_03710 [Planctomycetaceae bacterium]|nr:hypothetical protein [Planctomycetaceae bacterium]